MINVEGSYKYIYTSDLDLNLPLACIRKANPLNNDYQQIYKFYLVFSEKNTRKTVWGVIVYI